MSSPDFYFAALEIRTYTALLMKFFNEALENRLHQIEPKINGLQYGILQMLGAGNLTISVLSQRLGMDPSTLVRAVDVLERMELAERGSDPKDRRRNPITITPKGWAILQAVPALVPQDAIFKALLSIGAEPVGQLRDLLRDTIQQFPEGKMVVEAFTNQQTHL
jgi:DNA-binding MarR family transcriptional regulator